MNKTELELLGRIVSLNNLVAMALAIANRDHEDARGALASVVSSSEQQMQDVLAVLAPAMGKDDLEALIHAASDNTIQIGQMADSYLQSMGHPPSAES